MSDNQNSLRDRGSTTDDEACPPEGSLPKSYYYDDSTGYEIYKEGDAEEDDEENGSVPVLVDPS